VDDRADRPRGGCHRTGDGDADDADPAEQEPHPEQGFRTCLGILRLVRSYGRERLEATCSRGLEIGARSYGSVQSILQHGLDRRAPSTSSRTGELPLLHPNIRGSGYYH
jgi:transposase